MVTNPVKRRSTLKNLMVTYAALQKVYRSRLDEGRSNIHPALLAQTYIKYPLLIESRNNYEGILSKNTTAYFGPMFFTKIQDKKSTSFSKVLNTNSFILLDIPFLLSLKSDASRYL